MADPSFSIINWDADAMLDKPEIQIPRLIELCGFNWSDEFLTPDITVEFIKYQKNIIRFDAISSADFDSSFAQNQFCIHIANKLQER